MSSPRADALEQSLADGAAGGVHGAAAHPRLARRRRRAGRADLGVDRLEHDDVDTEHRAGDLLGDRDETLADLGGGELQRRHTVGEPAARRRVVVEALGVHQVLDRHTPTDASPHVLGVGGQPGAPGQQHRVTGRTDRRVRHRQRHRLTDAPGHRRHALHDLTGDQLVARAHRVAQADLDWVEPARLGQLVHLTLVGEARLNDTEPTHRPAGQVVGAHGPPLDHGVRAAVRPLAQADGVDEDGRRRRREGPAVEHEAGLQLDDLTGRRGLVAHPDLGRVTVDVAEEALGAAVGHAHGTAEAQRQQARVHLQADVLPRAERPADAAEHEPDSVLRESEAGGDLLAVLVQPLRGDVQLDAPTVVIGDGERSLEPEERLVLHPDLVRPLDHDLAGGIGVAAADPLMAQDVAIRVDRRMRAGDRLVRVEQRLEHLVRDLDGVDGPPARLRVIGGDHGDGLADEADVVGGEHRLVGTDQAVGRLARHVGCGEHGGDARHRQRLGHVDRDDARVRVRRAQGGTPHRAVDRQVRREGEAALGLDDPVRPHRRVADTPSLDPTPCDDVSECHGRPRSTATCCTAAINRP